MGSRYSVLIANGGQSLEGLLAALGANHWESSGDLTESPLPEGKLETDEALWFTEGGWAILVLGYAVGRTAGADATTVAQVLSECSEIRYFCREDTAGELYAQSFVDGMLQFGHGEGEGIVMPNRQLGPPPTQNRYEQTDIDALLASLMPPGMSLSRIEGLPFQQFKVRWFEAPPKKRSWLPWRKMS